MKIVAVSRSLPGHAVTGGMEQMAHDLFTAWSRRGHEVVCVTTPGHVDHGQEYAVVMQPGRAGRYSWTWRRALPAAVAALSPDIVFSVSGGAHGPLVKRSRVPVVLQAHGTSIDEIRTKLRSLRPINWLKAVKNVVGLIGDLRSYRHYSTAIAVSESVRASMNRFPRFLRAESIVVIPNGVRESEGERVEATGPLRVAFVGRLKHEKSADLLVQAATGQPWAVSVIGAGPEREALGRLAGPNVSFLGDVSHGGVLDRLRSTDVLVAVSRRIEGLPLVVLEALAAGVACVVSRQIAGTFDGEVPRGVIIVDTSAAAVRAGVERAATATPTPKLPHEYGIDRCAERYLSVLNEVQGDL